MAEGTPPRQQLAWLRAELQRLESLRAVLGDELAEQSMAPLRERIAALEAGVRTEGGAVVLGDVDTGGGDLVGRDQVFGSVYHVYLSSPGQPALSEEDVRRTLDDYLQAVRNAYHRARLYGLERLPTAQDRPMRELREVFVPLSLCRFRPPREADLEELAGGRGDRRSLARASLAWAERLREDAAPIPLEKLLTVSDRVAVVGGAGSGKSTLLSYLAVVLAEGAQGVPVPLELPEPGRLPIPLLVPLRYYRDYLALCARSPQERLQDPRAGTLPGFIPWYLKRRSPALGVSADFFDRLLLGGGCLLMLDGLDEVVSGDAQQRGKGDGQS